jgi:hypothetical protein
MTNYLWTHNAFDRPFDGASLHFYPGTSCLATIVLSLRDKTIHPAKRLALSQRLWVETLG